MGNWQFWNYIRDTLLRTVYSCPHIYFYHGSQGFQVSVESVQQY